ncbi:MAG: hypothetical protein K1X65_15475 [Caldilineales bacterium]|nr:hypothetical protein [Caldilineales bacterium]MCW5857643.1 DinB family protein [Caldilineales bacterium]
MNTILRDQYPLFEHYQALRSQMLDLLTDDDLAFAFPANPTLGELCREIGEIEHCYVESFRTFSLSFDFRADDPALERNLARLREWFAQLDADLHSAISALSDEDCENRLIDRGGWRIPSRMQLEIYKEALLIFYGKASVYLKALDKPRTEQWSEWIA